MDAKHLDEDQNAKDVLEKTDASKLEYIQNRLNNFEDAGYTRNNAEFDLAELGITGHAQRAFFSNLHDSDIKKSMGNWLDYDIKEKERLVKRHTNRQSDRKEISEAKWEAVKQRVEKAGGMSGMLRSAEGSAIKGLTSAFKLTSGWESKTLQEYMKDRKDDRDKAKAELKNKKAEDERDRERAQDIAERKQYHEEELDALRKVTEALNKLPKK